MRRHRWSKHAFRLGTLLSVAFGAAACASFSPDAGMSTVSGIAAQGLRQEAVKVSTAEDVAAASARTRQLLKSSLSADASVRIALLNNRGLQAAYNELGAAEAIMVQASLPPNPTFSLSRVFTPAGSTEAAALESFLIAELDPPDNIAGRHLLL
jgi:hypothetical protein